MIENRRLAAAEEAREAIREFEVAIQPRSKPMKLQFESADQSRLEEE